MELVGPPAWTEEDLDWQRQLAAAVNPQGGFTLDRDIDLYQQGQDSYGQDDGEVSWQIPLGRVNWAVPEEVPLHHWSYTALSGHPAGFAGPLMASETLALAAVELFTTPDIVESAKAELNQRRAKQSYSRASVGAYKSLTESPESFWDGSWSG